VVVGAQGGVVCEVAAPTNASSTSGRWSPSTRESAASSWSGVTVNRRWARPAARSAGTLARAGVQELADEPDRRVTAGRRQRLMLVVGDLGSATQFPAPTGGQLVGSPRRGRCRCRCAAARRRRSSAFGRGLRVLQRPNRRGRRGASVGQQVAGGDGRGPGLSGPAGTTPGGPDRCHRRQLGCGGGCGLRRRPRSRARSARWIRRAPGRVPRRRCLR
jgi:hypothetical protein